MTGWSEQTRSVSDGRNSESIEIVRPGGQGRLHGCGGRGEEWRHGQDVSLREGVVSLQGMQGMQSVQSMQSVQGMQGMQGMQGHQDSSVGVEVVPVAGSSSRVHHYPKEM